MADRARQLARVRRAIAHHRPPTTITITGAGSMTPAIADLLLQLVALGRTRAQG